MKWRVHATLVLLGAAAVGCTPDSVRLALAFQQRADEVQAAVEERQNAALRVLLYRDMVARLERSGATLTAEARAALSAVWNDRDLLEFWRLQHERAAALRIAGVDAKLAADQLPLELLGKALRRKLERGENALAALAGDYVTGAVADKPDAGGTNNGSSAE